MELTMKNGFCEMNEVEMQEIDGGFSGQELIGEMLSGAITGAVGGAVTGGTASLGTLTVPGWVAGGVGGALIGGIGYCVEELYNGIVG